MTLNMSVACIQMNSGPEISDNLTAAAVLINDAAKAGAELVVTPENTDFMRSSSSLGLKTAQPSETHPGIQFFSLLARELGIWLLIGSMKVKISETHVANRSFLFSPKGQLMASYDKIHLFDADLPDGEIYRESDFVAPGEKAVVAKVEERNIGMSICYDVRFPHLYRTLAKNGAEILAIPAAFAVKTGKDHWETLLRARAIETGSYVIAPAQFGEHEGGRKTYGHSMIISPWGRVLAEQVDDKAGFIMHKLDFLQVAKARAAVASLVHDKEYECLKPKN